MSELGKMGLYSCLTECFRLIASSEAASADDQQSSGMLAMQRSAVVKRQAGKLHICVGVLASSQPLQIASITLGSRRFSSYVYK